MSVCTYVHRHARDCGRQRRPSRAGVEQWQAVVSHPVWVVGPELGPPQEQQAPLASSSPSSLHASS